MPAGRRRWRRWLPVLASAVASAGSVLVAPGDARADSCTAPDLIETMPADKATGVPTNASLFARYQANAQYQQEPVTLDQIDSAGTTTQTVPATFDETEGLLQITPPAPLTPGDSYVVHWPALRGIDTATLGAGLDAHFTAGATDDVLSPTFEGIASVSWDVSRETDSCTSNIEERYVFDLGLGAASDDGGRDSLTLVVFQTSGPGVDSSAPAPVLVRRVPPEGEHVSITSTILVGHVCFAAIVKDLTMKVSTSGAPVCVDTVAPPFFYSCGVSPERPGAPRPDGPALCAALALGLTLARRTNARARRAGRRDGAG